MNILLNIKQFLIITIIVTLSLATFLPPSINLFQFHNLILTKNSSDYKIMCITCACIFYKSGESSEEDLNFTDIIVLQAYLIPGHNFWNNGEHRIF